MDFQIDGVEYLFPKNPKKNLVKSLKTDLKINLDLDNLINSKGNNNSNEYNYTKKWLILKQNPITQDELKLLNDKYDLILNELFYSMKYGTNNNISVIDIQDNQNLNQELNLEIPENYFRFKNLLDINFEEV